jgi:LmbE family N-acetylglucosaminyl deacetylase
MKWIYLSPHFDDVAFSCGGLIWEQVESGDKVSIWTICAGEPPPGSISPYAQSLQERWETGRDAVAVRRAEDLLSSQRMGASSQNFSIPDAIYRRSPLDDSPLYTSDSDLFTELRQEESQLVAALRDELNQALPQVCELVCPLALGGHVDHRLVRAAAEKLDRQMWYYADYPYSVNPDEDFHEKDQGMHHKVFPVSERGLTMWQQSVLAHSSQISTFWSSPNQMRDAIRAYWKPIKGVRLWYFAQDIST